MTAANEHRDRPDETLTIEQAREGAAVDWRWWVRRFGWALIGAALVVLFFAWLLAGYPHPFG